jgi:hypothetical protein
VTVEVVVDDDVGVKTEEDVDVTVADTTEVKATGGELLT